MESCIPHENFNFSALPLSVEKKVRLFCARATTVSDLVERPWRELTQIFEKEHRHVCGHASYTDIKLLLQLNNLWNESVNKYLSTTFEECASFNVTACLQPARKVSLGSMYRSFNEVVYVDHLFLMSFVLYTPWMLPLVTPQVCWYQI